MMRLEVRGRWMAACRCTVQLSLLTAWAFVCPSVVDASPCLSTVVSGRLEVSERGCDCGRQVHSCHDERLVRVVLLCSSFPRSTSVCLSIV